MGFLFKKSNKVDVLPPDREADCDFSDKPSRRSASSGNSSGKSKGKNGNCFALFWVKLSSLFSCIIKPRVSRRQAARQRIVRRIKVKQAPLNARLSTPAVMKVALRSPAGASTSPVKDPRRESENTTTPVMTKDLPAPSQPARPVIEAPPRSRSSASIPPLDPARFSRRNSDSDVATDYKEPLLSRPPTAWKMTTPEATVDLPSPIRESSPVVDVYDFDSEKTTVPVKTMDIPDSPLPTPCAFKTTTTPAMTKDLPPPVRESNPFGDGHDCALEKTTSPVMTMDVSEQPLPTPCSFQTMTAPAKTMDLSSPVRESSPFGDGHDCALEKSTSPVMTMDVSEQPLPTPCSFQTMTAPAKTMDLPSPVRESSPFGDGHDCALEKTTSPVMTMDVSEQPLPTPCSFQTMTAPATTMDLSEQPLPTPCSFQTMTAPATTMDLLEQPLPTPCSFRTMTAAAMTMDLPSSVREPSPVIYEYDCTSERTTSSVISMVSDTSAKTLSTMPIWQIPTRKPSIFSFSQLDLSRFSRRSADSDNATDCNDAEPLLPQPTAVTMATPATTLDLPSPVRGSSPVVDEKTTSPVMTMDIAAPARLARPARPTSAFPSRKPSSVPVPRLDLSCFDEDNAAVDNENDYKEPPLSRIPTAEVRRMCKHVVTDKHNTGLITASYPLSFLSDDLLPLPERPPRPAEVPPLDLSCFENGDSEMDEPDYREPPPSRIPTAEVRRICKHPITKKHTGLITATYVRDFLRYELEVPEELKCYDVVPIFGINETLQMHYFPFRTHITRFFDRETPKDPYEF